MAVNRILYLVKISKQEYLKKTVRKGNFYMNTCKSFRKMAIEKEGGLVGDLHECSFPVGTKFGSEYSQIISLNEDDTESIAMCCAANYCIYCTYAVFAEAFPNCAIIPKEVFTGIIGNDDPTQYGVLLFKKPATIIDKIIAELSIRGLSGRCDRISYDDHKFCSQYPFLSKDYILDLCFHKRKDFEGQNEYRIATINTEGGAIDDLYIGELKDDEYEMIPIQPDRALCIETKAGFLKADFSWV